MAAERKYRRMFFGLLKELRIPEEERHGVQQRLTGKPSTKDWTLQDWDSAVAQLQRWAGNHDDPHAHVRADRPHGVAEEPGSWCTGPQADLVASLCSKVRWGGNGVRRDPVSFLLDRILADKTKALRKVRILSAVGAANAAQAAHDIHHVALTLTREEASFFIAGLRKLGRYYPVEQAQAGRKGPGGLTAEDAENAETNKQTEIHAGIEAKGLARG